MKLFSLLFLLITQSVFAQENLNNDVFVQVYQKKAEKIRELYIENKIEDAIELQFSVLKVLESLEETPLVKSKISDSYASLGRIYSIYNDSLSLVYVKKGIDLAKSIEEYHIIYSCYSIWFGLNIEPYDIEQMTFLADSCLKYAKLSNDNEQLVSAYINYSIFIIKTGGDFYAANNYAMKAERLLLNCEGYNIIPAANNLGSIFIFLNKEYKGRELYLFSYEKAKESNNQEGMRNAAYNLYMSYAETKEYSKSFEYVDIYIEETEIMYENMLNSRFSEANAKFETEKKDKIIAQKNRQLLEEQLKSTEKSKQKQIFMFAVLLLFVFVFVYYFVSRQKIKNEKRRVRQELIKAREFTQLRTKFLENIAHEIRTPLTLTKGYINLSIEKATANSDITNYLKNAAASADKILENANEILDVLKNDYNNLPEKISEIKLADFINKVFFSFNSVAKPKKIELVLESSLHSNLVIKTDKQRLEKILNNFLSNALKFSPNDNQIILKADLTDQLIISVKDFGLGIEKDENEKVFERFYQAENGAKIGGMGIGLSLAKEFAVSLGGDLTVESDLGQGCLFSLIIPKENLDSVIIDKDKEVVIKQSKSKSGYKSRILVVEDNTEMNNFIKNILERKYDVISCYNGVHAYEMAVKNKPDLILSDIMMPYLNGIELKEKLNTFPELKAIPFIFLSAKSKRFDVLDGLNLGVDDYITKPFDHNELFARIKNLIINKEEREKNLIDHINYSKEYNEKSDEKLIRKINQVISDNISNEDFKVDELSATVGYSQRQLTRIMKNIVGLTPVQYILEIRLQRAYVLLKEGQFNSLSEVSYNVGITSFSYFNKKFKARFGIMPREVKQIESDL